MTSFLTTLFDGKNPTQTTLLASAALGVAGLAAYSFFGNKKSTLAPALTEEETRDMMNSILSKMKMNASKYLQHAQKVQQQFLAQGQQISEEQVMQFLILPQFEEAIKSFQDEICQENDVDDDELEEAFNYYLERNDEELAEISKQMIAIYKGFGGAIADDEVTGSSDAANLSEADFIELLHEVMETIIEDTTIFVRDYVSENGKPGSPMEMQMFHSELMKTNNQSEASVLSKRGLTNHDLQQLMAKYQQSQEAMQIFAMMQIQVGRIFQNYGIQMQ
eukprot:gene11870-13397_t